MKNKKHGQSICSSFFRKALNMSIIIVCLSTISTHIYATEIYTQTNVSTLRLKKSSLKEMLLELKKQTKFDIIYDKEVENVYSKNIESDLSSSSLEEILKQLFDNSGVDYKIVNKTIILSISKKGKASDSAPDSTPAQSPQQSKKTIRINGIIKDDEGEPIIGASVGIEGTTTGAITDFDGKYSLIAPSDGTLIIRYVGYADRKIAINNKTVIDVVMEKSSTSLDEVVILGFGQTQKKIAQTGSMANITNKELMQSPVSNITNALAGRLPGLISIQRSGEPGRDASQLYIRGRATTNDASPLVTIDGIQKDYSALNILDPNEIENITILKDASATALYGVKGANGVIIITTKRGSEGKPVINFRSQAALQVPTRTPRFLGSYDYARLYNEAYFNDNPTATPDKAPYDAVALEAYRTHSDLLKYPDVDWVDEVLKNSLATQTNFSISGGTKMTRYFVNVGYMYQDGLYKTEKNDLYNPKFERKRYNFRSNVDINFDESFSLGLSLYGSIEDRNYPNVSAANMFGSLISRIPPNAFPIKYPTGYWGLHASSYGNPIAQINASGFTQEFNSSLSGMLTATKKLDSVLEGLSIKGNFSFDGYFKNNFKRTMSVEYATYNGEGDYNDLTNYTYRGTATPLGSPSSTYNQTRDTWYDISINYNRSFGQHDVTAFILGNRQHRVIGGAIPYVSQGLVGRLAYSYDNRYFAEFNMGYNGTDNFAKGKRYGFFPAVSLGWVALHDRELIKFLKLRGSYGLTGNDKLTVNGVERRWLFIEEFQDGPNYSFGEQLTSIKGIKEGPLANSAVTWETARRYNFGLELKLFENDLFGMIADVFYEKRKDMLITPRNLPYMLGVPTEQLTPLNNGITENKGFEVELNHRYSINKSMSYFVSGNLSYARNKILEYNEENQAYPNLYITGHRIGQQRGLVAIGFFKDEEDIINSRKQTFKENIIPGDIKYYDVNGDGQIDDNDVTAIGKSDLPDFMFGFSGGLNWKNFDLSFLFQGAAGFTFIRELETAYEFYNGGKVMEMHLGRWTPETAASATYPVLHLGLNENNHRASTFYQRKGDYLRLKNLELGYTFKGIHLSKNYNISSLRLYVSGMNLFTWDSTEGDFDPETSGGRYWSYPQVKVFNFGFSLTL